MSEQVPEKPSGLKHRPASSNVDPKTALMFVGGILVVVGLLTLAIFLIFGME